MDKFNYMCTYAYVHGTSALKSASAKLKERVNKVVQDESGMEIIAIILILVIVLAIVLIFKDEIGALVNKIFGKLDNESEQILGDDNSPIITTTQGGG